MAAPGEGGELERGFFGYQGEIVGRKGLRYDGAGEGGLEISHIADQ